MTTAIIVAAGSGSRMGAGVDKLFLEAAGRPIVVHTWQRFDGCTAIDQVVLVVRDEHRPAFDAFAGQYSFTKPYRIVAGGKERQDSVCNGLEAIAADSDLVAIHDGARPCTTPDLISATLDVAREFGAAVAAQRVIDTIKQSEDGRVISQHLDRARLWSVQTPQCFRTATIQRALRAARERGLKLTDDTAACDLIGQPVRLVESKAPNPKLTVPEDLPFIESLLRSA